MIDDAEIVAMLEAGVITVDRQGRVWRLTRRSRTGRLLRLRKRKRADPLDIATGYRRLYIIRPNFRASIMAHRVVWIAKRGPIPDGLEVNHKNLDKADNRPRNLELMTHLENVQHAIAHGHAGKRYRGEANPNSKLTAAQVEEIRSELARGTSKSSLGRRFAVSTTMIRSIANGRCWAAAMETT